MARDRLRFFAEGAAEGALRFIDVRLLHPLNAPAPIELMPVSVIEFSDEQPLNASSPMVFTLGGIVTVVRFSQSLNVPGSTVSTSGRVTVTSDFIPAKVFAGIVPSMSDRSSSSSEVNDDAIIPSVSFVILPVSDIVVISTASLGFIELNSSCVSVAPFTGTVNICTVIFESVTSIL